MKIFETYTGNAMLNNALMTIEALGNFKSVSEITPDVLLQLYNDKELLKLNKRLKSYTMLFTKNGPLHNDKANGDKTYEALFKTIINNFENEGDKKCEISGLKFNSTFKAIFEIALKSIGIPEKEIQKKDTNLSRTWFPLIGTLGSDAQALPQAKFTLQIHPICIIILQFLPLSSLIYNRNILLIDSSNFEFAREFIRENQRELSKRIQITKSTDPIENIKDFSKGNYILKALKILQNKEEEESYSDLNLWSFSNSGTGASCEIDRVPNSLIQKLINFKKYSPDVRKEMEEILNNIQSAFSFLNDLEDNKEWYLLYPNVFGSGKKKIEYNGVSVAFLEAYFNETGNVKKTEYAKYLAYLINKYKSKSFEKYLLDTSAWNEKDYRVDLYSVLVEATKNNEWNLYHQIQILDDSNQLPVKNTFFNIHKLVHFYYQKNVFINQPPFVENKNSKAKTVCTWLIALIARDEKKIKFIKELTNAQDYTSVGYTGLLLRFFESPFTNLKIISQFLYDENYLLSKNSINELLRIFFNQTEQQSFEIKDIELSQELILDNNIENWLDDFNSFSKDYQSYYFDKYKNRETGEQPYEKYLKLIQNISLETSQFIHWFRDATGRTNDFLIRNEKKSSFSWSDSLLYSPKGEFNIFFAKFAIKLCLLKQYQISFNEQNQPLIS